jgi:hypothetical protein
MLRKVIPRYLLDLRLPSRARTANVVPERSFPHLKGHPGLSWRSPPVDNAFPRSESLLFLLP